MTLMWFTVLSIVASAQVRTAAIQKDEILALKTALGIATIVHLPEPVQSAIIGDYSGFKVEHIDNAVTIKPLRPAARSNLYLVSEKRRYNIKLITVTQESADYVVYLKSRDSDASSPKWIPMPRTAESNGVRFNVHRVGRSATGTLLLDASLIAMARSGVRIKPEEFWIVQGGVPVTINSLYLSDQKVSKSSPILIGMSVLAGDINEKKDLVIEYRGTDELKVQLREPSLWK